MLRMHLLHVLYHRMGISRSRQESVLYLLGAGVIAGRSDVVDDIRDRFYRRTAQLGELIDRRPLGAVDRALDDVSRLLHLRIGRFLVI